MGKTSLRRSYLGEKFETNYLKTIGADFSFKQLSINDEQIRVSIWDLAGQEEYHNVHPMYFRGSAGAIIVYDVMDEETFNSIETWIKRYNELAGDNLRGPVLIIGNKTDLLTKSNNGISLEQQNTLVKDLTDKFGSDYVVSSRTSARTGELVEESFSMLVEKIINIQNKKLKVNEEISKLSFENYIPAAYITTFDDQLGPQIILKSPVEGSYSDKEFISAIKISSILDFQDVIDEKQITGSFPWGDPVGTFNYISFTTDHNKARGKKILFIIGFVSTREIKDIISGDQSIIDGFLHSVMNEFSSLLVSRNIDVLSSGSIKISHEDDKIEAGKILLNLRKNVFNLIKSKLI